MAAITASMVKELREQTGAGMMDCKKALAETDGNMEEAVEVLRKSGAAKAEKKASRIAAEGIAKAVIDGGNAVVVEVSSETDFVAKNEVFQSFVESVAKQALKSSLNGGLDGEDIEALLSENYVEDSSKTVKDALVEKTATIGEKLSIRRFEKASGDVVVSYIHGGGRIGVLVAADGANDDAAKEALTNVAMQVAALNPKYISDADVDQAYIDHETEIIKAQMEADPKEAAKPENVKQGMIKGRISKLLKDVVLLDQVYVKAEDGKQTVANYLASVNKALVIKKIVRFEVGEGMEKKNEDFAAEVAAQMNA
ncbi:MAG: translation elongation factor Ts [Lachnospiraceae bacterium]|nr:translation elongation factor Ts [Lachnospiraceae bacterium]